jgi:hypothetical protein
MDINRYLCFSQGDSAHHNHQPKNGHQVNRASDRGRIGIFYALKNTKKRIGDDVGDFKFLH